MEEPAAAAGGGGVRGTESLTADICVERFQGGVARYGLPEVVNTDQGSRFTGIEFVSRSRT